MTENEIVMRYERKTRFKTSIYKAIAVILNVFLICCIIKQWFIGTVLFNKIIGFIMLGNLLYSLTDRDAKKHPEWKFEPRDYSYLNEIDQNSITTWGQLSINEMDQYANGWKDYMIHMIKLTIVYWIFIMALHYFAVWIFANGILPIPDGV